MFYLDGADINVVVIILSIWNETPKELSWLPSEEIRLGEPGASAIAGALFTVDV